MDTSTSIWTTTLIPLLSTLALLSRSPDFSWATCVPYMLPMLIPLLARMPKWTTITGCFRGGCAVLLKKPELSFTARLKLRSWDDEPNSVVRNFSTVLWEWNRFNKVANCKHLLEEATAIRYYDEQSNTTPPFFVDDAVNRFWNVDCPDVLYTMWVERTTDREGTIFSEVLVRIDFMALHANPNRVIEHLEFIAKEAKRIGAERHRVQRVLVSTTRTDSGEEGVRGPAFMAYEFHTTSGFNNFFCEEAETVRADLRHFLENKASYTRTGRPWTYTVLNEGPPGVGKTKLVKAIAAMTGYTLIVINLAHIKTAQMLYEAFHTTTLAGETVPHDKRLYYIPEVDTQLFEALKSRKNDAETEGLTAAASAAAAAAAAAASTVANAVAVTNAKAAAAGKQSVVAMPGLVESKAPTLGEILNVLDGVPERHGHILILDTNHLADLDPALIRPGRVDRILSWRKLSSDSMRRFLENYYSVTIPKTVVFPDRVYSAAELQSLAAQRDSWETFGAEKLRSARRTTGRIDR